MLYYSMITIAQAGGEQRPNWLIGGMPIILLVIMMFFLFRSQKKQSDQRKAMLAKIKVGDQVVTNGGIMGTVMKVKDKSFLVKIAEKVEVEVVQNGIGTVLAGGKADE